MTFHSIECYDIKFYLKGGEMKEKLKAILLALDEIMKELERLERELPERLAKKIMEKI